MKRTSIMILSLLGMLFICSNAKAWNCTTPGQIRVQVPSGTQGSGHGNGDGQVNTVEGITFQCQKPTDPDKKHEIEDKHEQHQDQHQSQGQSQHATGGSVTGSGNSNNTNTSTSNSDASANNSGNNGTGNSTSINNNSSYNQVHQTASAIAPDALPSSPCVKGFSGAAQSGFFGASMGGGKIDKGCDDRETARSFALMGNKTASAKILCQTPASKRAHLTLEDCLHLVPELVPVTIMPAPEPTVVEKIVEVPTIVKQELTTTSIGSFTLKEAVLAGTCGTYYVPLTPAAKVILDKALAQVATDTNKEIVLYGSVRNTGAAAKYLSKNFDAGRILSSSEKGSTVYVVVREY